MKLKTETPKNGSKAITAFFKSRHVSRTRRKEFDYNFEHGQLWIMHNPSGAAWSVVDAEGGPAIDGFDFEMVSIGDEEDICWVEPY